MTRGKGRALKPCECGCVHVGPVCPLCALAVEVISRGLAPIDFLIWLAAKNIKAPRKRNRRPK